MLQHIKPQQLDGNIWWWFAISATKTMFRASSWNNTNFIVALSLAWVFWIFGRNSDGWYEQLFFKCFACSIHTLSLLKKFAQMMSSAQVWWCHLHCMRDKASAVSEHGPRYINTTRVDLTSPPPPGWEGMSIPQGFNPSVFQRFSSVSSA
jgi:hypothetical protein